MENAARMKNCAFRRLKDFRKFLPESLPDFADFDELCVRDFINKNNIFSHYKTPFRGQFYRSRAHEVSDGGLLHQSRYYGFVDQHPSVKILANFHLERLALTLRVMSHLQLPFKQLLVTYCKHQVILRREDLCPEHRGLNTPAAFG